MKNEKLHRAITNIDDSLITEADEKRKKNGFLKYASIAAALALVIGITAAVTAAKFGGRSRFSVTDIDFGKYQTVPSGDRNVVVHEKKEIGGQIEEFFNKNKRGFIARITPIEYRFYYEIKEDEFSGTPYIDGYAECICKIDKASAKYNTSTVKDEAKIIVFSDLYLSPSNSISEETLLNLMTDIGAYKNRQTKTGVYAIPAEYVNENDFNILTHDPRGALPLCQSFYAFINEDISGNYCFSYVCPTSDEALDGLKWDDDIRQSALNFRAFVLENDKSVTE